MRLILAGGLAIGLVAPTLAQQTVITRPQPVTSAGGDASGTITSTNTFQKVFAGANNTVAPTVGTPGQRNACLIQNNGTHIMYVTEGKGISASTLLNSWQISANGGLFYCTQANVILVGEIDVTGTSGDAFVASQE